jgi:4,5-DOPA dioxygenase extradiol
MSPLPVLFISHGAPTFALEPGVLGPALTALGGTLGAARAVLVVSPHWQTPGVEVLATAAPPTIHDFGGFDPALYTLSYPAPGHPALAAEAARLVSTAGFAVRTEAARGLDHGAWVPLMHLRPHADLPVFQVSMPLRLDGAGALGLGRALAPLREQGVVIVGSGSLTHNLRELQDPHAAAAAYAREFADWAAARVATGELESLADYRRRAPHASRAHPTEEHYLPLVVAAAAAAPAERATRIPGGILYGVLSMDSFVWGRAAGAA